MAEDSAMKRIGIMLLQLLVTGAGIWYVFYDPQKRAQIADALREADRNWVILDAVNSWQLSGGHQVKSACARSGSPAVSSRHGSRSQAWLS
jgi:hypothetical protein